MEVQTTEKVLFKSPIADPMATDKLASKLLNLTKKCIAYYKISGERKKNQKRS